MDIKNVEIIIKCNCDFCGKEFTKSLVREDFDIDIEYIDWDVSGVNASIDIKCPNCKFYNEVWINKA